MRRIIASCLLWSSLCATAQVSIDKPVVLDGASDAQRQVEGLAPALAPAAAQSAQVEAAGTHKYAQATNTWQVDLPSLTGAPAAGTQIVVQVPATPGTGAVQLLVNGTGPYAVLLRPNDPFFAENAANTPMLSLVYDGTAFQVLNGTGRTRRDCPADMIAVNSQYCIEFTDRDTVSFFEAARICALDNKRLCTWGEWHGACNIRTQLGLQEMTDNWEYTDDSANENNSIRIAGPSCTQAAAWYVYNEYQRFRCCYTR